jgi:hypothetical protein
VDREETTVSAANGEGPDIASAPQSWSEGSYTIPLGLSDRNLVLLPRETLIGTSRLLYKGELVGELGRFSGDKFEVLADDGLVYEVRCALRAFDRLPAIYVNGMRVLYEPPREWWMYVLLALSLAPVLAAWWFSNVYLPSTRYPTEGIQAIGCLAAPSVVLSVILIRSLWSGMTRGAMLSNASPSYRVAWYAIIAVLLSASTFACLFLLAVAGAF